MKRKSIKFVIIGIVFVIFLSLIWIISARIKNGKEDDLRNALRIVSASINGTGDEKSSGEIENALNVVNDYVVTAGTEKLKKVLLNDSIPQMEREFFIESIREKWDNFSESEKETILALTTNKQYDTAIRSKLIQCIPSDTAEGKNLIQQLLTDEDATIVSDALLKLYEIDQEDAIAFAADKLNHYMDQKEDIVSTSLYITMKAVNAKTADRSSFLKQCENMLNNPDCSAEMKETVGSNLASLPGMDTLTIIMHSDLSEQIKITCISQSYLSMMDCLDQDPDRDSVEMIVHAMEILPITEVIEKLDTIAGTYNLDIQNLNRMESVPGNVR